MTPAWATQAAFSCRTSLTTRLIMLLGAYAGRRESLSISRRNPIKFYEFRRLWQTHNELLADFTDRDSSTLPFHAQGLNFTSMTAAQLKRFQACCHAKAPAHPQPMHFLGAETPSGTGCLAPVWIRVIGLSRCVAQDLKH